jgi:hypothetical protein
MNHLHFLPNHTICTGGWKRVPTLLVVGGGVEVTFIDASIELAVNDGYGE